MLTNIFDTPQKYLDIIRSSTCIKEENQKRHNGKSMVVVHPTRHCKVGCTHCIFYSQPKRGVSADIKDEMSWTGCNHTIQFINAANVEYLLIAGGGEPFEKEEVVCHMVEHCFANRIVIATNGFWGKTKAVKVLIRLQEILERRNDDVTLVLRLSLDEWHTDRIGNGAIVNIIKAFDEFGKHPHLKLELHTIENDKSIDVLQKVFPNSQKQDDFIQVVSDNNTVLKNSKKRGVLTLASGLEIPIGYAKLFYPNLLIDLNRSDEDLRHIMKPFYEDVLVNQKGNYCTIHNSDGTVGLDYLINFNGNITTWGNYQLDSVSNIYIDSYDAVQRNLYNDIVSYAFIDKDHEFRESIVEEVNLHAVRRASGVNIRDYSGALLLQEHHTCLYFAVRMIQHYLSEGILDQSILDKLPFELSAVICADQNNVLNIYQKSNYSIIQQYMESNCTENDWRDLYRLINLNHYRVTEEQKKQGLKFFNDKFGTTYTHPHELISDMDAKGIISRLMDRMNLQQSKVEELYQNPVIT
ncbi:radical SAM protein [Thermoactinomyces sp. DSM 45892]|uniref:radical SAM protein n=1 Tax=Thermoactinomyces sp. DSM 45892 TaxID=1882753 RepID=UPI000899E734|nr:radical SAM protein [Thermoactinomyces sp. DSM 45892]SDX92773.1 hypothetical protein SAMN05444416_10128 [Thermoactinomyces sp. DSM 45892]